MNDNYKRHYPVMLPEVLASLDPQDGKIYVDATFGNGGYSEAILNHANCTLIALDRDPSVLPRVQELKEKFGERFIFIQGQFSDFQSLVNQPIDGAVFDIGVSSMQLDDAQRGFSFTKDAPLDMRMSSNGVSAKDLVNELEETELANIIYQYGEEKKSRHIARRIVEKRKIKPIETTKELAEIIYTVIRKTPNTIDPATRTFQALRIEVNNELGELKSGLDGATNLLKDEGRLVIVDFHSLEDRIVKNYFNEKSGKTKGVSRYMPVSNQATDITFKFCSKAILPSNDEINENPRSRSAKLRYAIKCKH